MLGTGLGHLVPIVAYLGFWVMCLVSLGGKPLYGFYYMIPFIPYRTLRDHFLDYPLGENMLTILVLCVIIGGVMSGKRLPKTPLYKIWLIMGIYLYLSMWVGTIRGVAPAPLWLHDINFVTWKDYMVIPLVFLAAGLVIQDRKAIRTVVLITAIALLFIDRSCILESMSRTWVDFDENKRSGGPLAFGSNQTAAFLAQFAIFFWGFGQYVKKITRKLAFYGLVAATIFAAMYTFSRAGYLAILLGVLVIGVLKDRKLLLVLGAFLMTWQAIVPDAVSQRVDMTRDSSGHLERSAQERVDLWKESWDTMQHNPIVGTGYATFQMVRHVDNLRDTHNWYVKILVETGLVGFVIVLILLAQSLALSFRLFRRSKDPLYKGLGLGLFAGLWSAILANIFGDRWTYLEITGLLWVLLGAAARANQLNREEEAAASPAIESQTAPALAYQGRG